MTPDNSNIRMKDGIINVTYRNEQLLDVDGKMTLMPFSLFDVNFRFELSHFEMDIDDKHYLIRFIYHQHKD